MFWFNNKMIEDNHHETNVIGRSNFMAFIIIYFFFKTFKRRIQEGSTRPPFKKMKKKWNKKKV